VAKDHDDPLAKERLVKLVLDLEEQLRDEKAAHGLFKRADELEQQASELITASKSAKLAP
jgi:hypothetical protein